VAARGVAGRQRSGIVPVCNWFQRRAWEFGTHEGRDRKREPLWRVGGMSEPADEPWRPGTAPCSQRAYEVADTAPAERLRRARLARYRSAARFAAAVGVPQSTYRMHEAGHRTLTIDVAKQYAAGLGVDFVWLLHGAGDSGLPAKVERHLRDVRNLIAHNVMNTPGDDELGHMVGVWEIPEAVIAWAHDAPNATLRILQVDSDDMEPTMRRGDPVLVNVAATSVTAAGIYLLKSELGYFFRRIEPLPGSDPPELRLSCDNPRYQPHTARLDRVSVRGRALGLVVIQKF
jgi:transcriptional regulator with XRE-family HTH domain